jgi:hypothetical protein
MRCNRSVDVNSATARLTNTRSQFKHDLLGNTVNLAVRLYGLMM